MFIPLRTNRPPRRRPIVTELIIVVNMLVYLGFLVSETAGGLDRAAWTSIGHLGRQGFRPWQLVTYQFLHDPTAIWHLGFNMLFLWVFGCAVEDRIGRLGFLGFYLFGGAVAGIAHLTISPAPVIGASGAVAAVTGAFLALFPRSRIIVLIFFFGVFAVPALWFIGFYFALDVLRQTGAFFVGGRSNVAYMAHIGGYLYGFAFAFTLLALRIVKREEFDVFFLLQQWRRRAAFRAANRGQTAGAWDSAAADVGSRLARQTQGNSGGGLTEGEQAQARRRAEINRRAAAHDLPGAAAAYRELLAEDETAVLGAERQLDLANQLHAEGDYETAATAYELLLARHPTGARGVEVRLLLAALYARRLARPDRARALLDAIRDRLTDDGQRDLAEALRAEVGP